MSNSSVSKVSADTGKSAINLNTDTWRRSMKGMQLVLAEEHDQGQGAFEVVREGWNKPEAVNPKK